MFRSPKTPFISVKLCVAICIVTLAASSVWAQSLEENLIQDLTWRSIGPANMSGRISDIEAVENDFATVFVASASGGVFKSTNAGTTWTPIFDKYGSASIGDIAIYQKNPDVIWVGTGERNPRNSIAWGDGVYKSTDGGETFTNVGLQDTHSIGRIITHPDDPDTVWVAAAGHLWGYTGRRGLFKTTDGGRTWDKLTNGLPNDGKTGAIELVIHPDDPDTLYVGFWQRLRQPWRFDSGGPNGGIFKSTDGGDTWLKLTRGLPEGDTGKIGLAISRSNPDVLMAWVEAEQTNDLEIPGSGVYRTENGGRSWEYVNTTNNRPFYYSHIYINPFDDQIVYLLATSYTRSFDGGRTTERAPGGIHGDYHALWLDPTNKDRYYIGSDGGTALTYNHGDTYKFYDNLCFAQFYAIGVDMRDPYYIYGGLQDNGTWGGPSNHRSGEILTDHWFNIGGGDGFHAQVDPTDWTTVYVESQGGSINRRNAKTRASTSIRPSRNNVINYDEYVTEQPAAAGQRSGRSRSPFRFNWSAPIVLSPHNPQTVFFGGNHLFKSVNRGDNWMIISPDLTTNDPVKMDRNTGGLTRDATGAENHCNIITISESPVTPGLIWVGTDDGLVQITRDGGENWDNVRGDIPDVPEGIWCSRVEASHFEEGVCYATFDGHRSDNFEPYVFKTDDYGQTWINITNNIPFGQCAYVIKEDLKNPNLLFVGTEFALFYSITGGDQWCKLNKNMPTVAIHDLVIHPRDNDLIAATHGRGIWIMDDITALQQATPEVLESDFHLFESRPSTNWIRMSTRDGYGRGSFFFRGQTAPRGSTISYYVKDEIADGVEITVTDASGNTGAINGAGTPGIHRVSWNGRLTPPGEAAAPAAPAATRTGRAGQGGRGGAAATRTTGAAGQQQTFTDRMIRRVEQAIEQTTDEQRQQQLRQLLRQIRRAGDDPERQAQVRARMTELLGAGGGRAGQQRAAQQQTGRQRAGQQRTAQQQRGGQQQLQLPQIVARLTEVMEQAIKDTDSRQRRGELRRLLRRVQAAEDLAQLMELRAQLQELLPGALEQMMGQAGQRGQQQAGQRGQRGQQQASQRGQRGGFGGRGGVSAGPGEYGVKVIINGQTYSTKLVIREDPLRIKK